MKQATLGLMFLFTVVLVACSGPATQVVKETVKETVVVGGTPQIIEKVVEKVVTPTAAAGSDKVALDTCVGTEPPTMDSLTATDSSSTWFISQMFVGLLGFDEKAEVTPYLATEWKPSADGLKWTFKLRKDIPWVQYNPASGQVEQVLDQNKKPVYVTAKAVEYGVKRTLNPKNASDYSYVLYPLQGAEEYNSADVKALNDAALKKLEDAVGIWMNEVFSPRSGQNYAKFNDPKFTDLIQAAARETDPAKRKDLYGQAEKLLIEEDMGIAPIYHATYFRLFKPYLTQHPLSPVANDPVSQWKIDWSAKKAARGGR